MADTCSRQEHNSMVAVMSGGGRVVDGGENEKRKTLPKGKRRLYFSFTHPRIIIHNR